MSKALLYGVSIALASAGLSLAASADDDRAERRAAILEEYDADGDGRLGRDERRALHDARRENRSERRLERFDADGDGRLSREERDSARAERDAHPRRDRDHNPPGRRGGPGTNWENPPGRRGGPGASPDRR